MDLIQIAKDYAESAKLAEQSAVRCQALQEALLEQMQSAGLQSLDTDNFKLALVQRKAGKSLPSERLLALQEELAAESEEMIDANKHKIYALRRQIFMLENELALMERNEHTEALQQAITEEYAKLTGQSRFAIKLIALHASSPDLPEALTERCVAEGMACADICGKALTRRQTETFASTWLAKQSVFGKAFDEQAFLEAWADRRNGHIAYWLSKR